MDEQRRKKSKRAAPAVSKLAVPFCALLLLGACSSAPKRPVEIFTVQVMAETQLELANRAADEGDYGKALGILTEARRLAVSTDRPSLRLRVSLAQGNVFFYQGRVSEAGEIWAAAETEAAEAGENALAAACRIYMARSQLITSAVEGRAAIPGAGDNSTVAGSVLLQVRNDLGAVKSDKLLTALAWTVIGLAEKELSRFAEAEKSLKNALSIHENGRYLNQAAYDWYLIASVRSVAENYSGAQAALALALGFDRRAENTYGLAQDWAAKGDVFHKMGDTASAVTAWRRSAEIFRTLALEEDAAAVEKRIDRQ